MDYSQYTPKSMRNYMGDDDLQTSVAQEMADLAIKNFLDKHTNEPAYKLRLLKAMAARILPSNSGGVT